MLRAIIATRRYNNSAAVLGVGEDPPERPRYEHV